jgi:DNA-binding response OmpR family regulator
LQRLFRSAGSSVVAFPTALELLSSLPVDPPDCVILDLQLPGMSGVELLRSFSVLAEPPPVIVITGDDDERLREQCMALGSKRYFRKPLDCDALLEAARDVVERANRDRSSS